MRIDLSQAKPSGTELVTANITSLTLLLSTTVFLAVICRYFKRCWKKLRGKPKKDLDMTALSPVGKISLHKNRSTAIHTRRRHMIRQDKIPFDTEDVSVQPVLYTDMSIKDDPMSPGFPTNSRNYCKFGRQQSTPLRLERRSIITSRRDIKSFDLDPSLYKKEESLKSFQASSRKKCGIIDMEVYFDEKARQLEVTVYSMQHLLAKEYAKSMSTYITVKKLPEKAVQRTSLHTKAVNPVFNNKFKFHVSSEDDVASQVLIFELNHMDRFCTSYLRGEVRLPLFQLDLSSRPRLLVPFLECRRSFLSSFHPTHRRGPPGSLLVSLQFHQQEDVIIVNPIRVCNIPQKGYGEYGDDVYVKVILRHRCARQAKMKTQPTKLLRMPQTRHYYEARFDEPLSLNLNSKPVKESNITISLNRYLFLKSSFIIGQVRLSTNEPGYEATHYQSVLNSPGEQITVWYDIYSYSTSGAIQEIEK